MKKLYYISLFLFAVLKLNAQDCPELISPLNGQINVPINATISWEPVAGVNAYIISLGTSPGAVDILNEFTTGLATSYTSPIGLPEQTEIFVTITLFFIDQPEIVCPSQSFTTEDFETIPVCSSLDSPLNGAVDVNVGTNISWNYALGATSYIIYLGTSPGVGDIVNNLDVGNTLSFNPPTDLPALTEIFVTIIPYNENGTKSDCAVESFTTAPAAELPPCTTIISPEDGEVGVLLTPYIEWEAVPEADGYRVYIGRTPNDNDILDGGAFFTNGTFVINFEPNTVYFIRIVPFNTAGDAIGCGQTTFATILGCGPFLDTSSGEFIDLNPVLTLPDTIGICINEVPRILTAPDEADGYRWYQYNDFDEPVLISESNSVELFEEGLYAYEAYILNNESAEPFECSSIQDFTVVASEAPQLEFLDITETPTGFDIIVNVEGSGDYEFALEDVDVAYQDSNAFFNVPEDTEYLFVRDRNGCGTLIIDLSLYQSKDGFPLFFTPNGDGFNDFWQFKPSSDDDFVLKSIHLYDRYGKLLKTINPNSRGWDGSFRGNLLPTATFWYNAETFDGRYFQGYFTLKR